MSDPMHQANSGLTLTDNEATQEIPSTDNEEHQVIVDNSNQNTQTSIDTQTINSSNTETNESQLPNPVAAQINQDENESIHSNESHYQVGQEWFLTTPRNLFPRAPPPISISVTEIASSQTPAEEDDHFHIPRADSPTIRFQEQLFLDGIRRSANATESELPPITPSTLQRRTRVRSPSSDLETRVDIVEHIGAQDLDRVSLANWRPRSRDEVLMDENEEDERVEDLVSSLESTLIWLAERAVRRAAASGETSPITNSRLRRVGNSLMVNETQEDGIEEGEIPELIYEEHNEPEETSSSETNEYYFTTQRREQLMELMRRDINQYNAHREEEFGREHGYQLYPLHIEEQPTSQNSIPIPAPVPNSSEPSEASAITPRRLRRRALTNSNLPSWRSSYHSPPLISRNSSPFPNPRIRTRRHNISIGPRLLTSTTQDHSRDFSLYLHTTWSLHSQENNYDPQLFSLTLPELLETGFFSFLPSIPTDPPNFEEQFEFRELVLSLPNETLRRIMVLAEQDGFDSREGTHFIGNWNRYLLHFHPPYPDIERMIPLLHIQFFIALRQGWGSWSPSEDFLTAVRTLFMEESTRFHHIPWDGVLRGPRDPRGVVMRWITDVRIPEPERRRMLGLVWDGVDVHRVVGIFQTWLEVRGWVESTRRPEENGVDGQELRLDRLERIIREEKVLNVGTIF